MGRKPLIIACIPAFNEEKTIARVVLQAQRYVDRVIVCDDGSTDMTAEIAERLGAVVIRHGRNMGYGVAITSLLDKAREMLADVAVTLDADGQHDPNDIPRLVRPILEGKADIVLGSRYLSEGGTPAYRSAGVKTITALTKAATKLKITDAQSGFRAYSRRALSLISTAEMGMGVSTEILLKASEQNLRIVEVPAKIRYDVERPSKRNPIYHGLDVLLTTVKVMSIRHPLMFYGIPGAISLVLALAFWVWTLQIYAATKQVVTNIALIAIGATMVGLTLLTTAMILWVLVSVLRER